MNASLQMLHCLELMGHEVVAASPRDVSTKVKNYGFSYQQLSMINFDPAPKTPDYKGRGKRVRGLVHRMMNFKSRRAEAIRRLGMEQFQAALKKIKPDLIIIDVELHEHIMTAYSQGYKLVLLSQWFSIWNRRRLPPIQSDILPGEGFWGSELGMRLSWWLIILKRWKIFLQKKITTWYTDRRSILQHYAKQIGFPLNYIRENFWPGPFVYDALPVMSMTAEELEFPHHQRPNHVYLGPMIYEPRISEVDDASTIRLHEVLSSKGDRKLIYCSVSSFSKGDAQFVKRVIEAVSHREDWILVVSKSGTMNLPSTDLASNIFIFDWINQLLILSHADCSINHGGIHTINECLHFCVPMLVYSGKRSDQNGCAARVTFHGIGIRADKDADDVAQIQQKISEVLYSSTYYENIEKLNQSIAQNTNQKLEQTIQHILQQEGTEGNNVVNINELFNKYNDQYPG